MDKLEFFTRVEAAKKQLPNSVVPLFIKKYPEFDTYKKRSRVTNVVQLKLIDEDILNKLESLADFFKN